MKVKLLVLFFLAALTVTAVAARQTRLTYEYKVLSESRVKEDKLTKLGAEGWELVAVVPMVSSGATIGAEYYFKRAK